MKRSTTGAKKVTDDQVDFTLPNDIDAAFINVINLDLKWSQKFEKPSFVLNEFTNIRGEKIKCRYMDDENEFMGMTYASGVVEKHLEYFKNNSYKGVIKYYHGEQYTQVFILPKKENCNLVEFDDSIKNENMFNLPTIECEKIEFSAPKTNIKFKTRINTQNVDNRSRTDAN